MSSIRAELCAVRRVPIRVNGFERKRGAWYRYVFRTAHERARVERVYGNRAGMADIRDARSTLEELDMSMHEVRVIVVWQPPYEDQVYLPPCADRMLGRFFDATLREEFVVFSEYVERPRTTAPGVSPSRQP